ncbi:MAG: FAD-dependent oxidoreductase [Planctomycetes bacterium]|nr:FAD-dependent oxidoreductase [Planctomycetota bacterium]
MTAFDDLVVIGGGIHGAGIAQAAAAAGHSVLLLEAKAIAHGTSSRSSKLIHGGLRYLETAQFGLVRESLEERSTLLQIAPGLVRLVPFHIPVYGRTTRRPWQIRAGLSLYALLGNLCRDARFTSLPRSEWDALDGLSTDGLQAVYRYHDGQTDDAALTRAVVRSAESLGCRVECPARFDGAEERPHGWRVRYGTEGRQTECDARALVNAAGPWANEALARISPNIPHLPIDLVQGAHIEMEGTIGRGIYYVESPSDRRAVFVMPRFGRPDRILIGTTETPYNGHPDACAPRPEEIAYLTDVFHRHFPERPARVLNSFAGLRVLPRGEGAAFHRPRDVVLTTDPRTPPRLAILYGGKLTGYRATAQKVMRVLAGALPARKAVADTSTLAIA